MPRPAGVPTVAGGFQLAPHEPHTLRPRTLIQIPSSFGQYAHMRTSSELVELAVAAMFVGCCVAAPIHVGRYLLTP